MELSQVHVRTNILRWRWNPSAARGLRTHIDISLSLATVSSLKDDGDFSVESQTDNTSSASSPSYSTPKERYTPVMKEFWDNIFGEVDETKLGPNAPTVPTYIFEDEELVPLSGSDEAKWCSLCGSGEGWAHCAACNGTGIYLTAPGLAGKSKLVGEARCKSCYGRGVVPCFICGITDPKEWMEWHQHARRWPKKINASELKSDDIEKQANNNE